MGSPAIFAGKRSKLLSSKGLLYSNGSINDYNGDINYILNGHAEVNTAGWATYADAAQSTPVDGTGGSPSVTWTQTTTSPLDDLGSFVFTKDAVNRQGQGASYAFTIDSASQAKVMTITFDYIVGSGTFVAGAFGVDSDLEVYIYDVTNSVLIQPSTYKLYSNSSTVASQFIANFQTPYNSTSYRLIFHCATTSASAYTVKFDNVRVSPTQYTYGTPITDWSAYTPTITGCGTVAQENGHYWRRVGSNLEVRGEFVTGTPTATAFSISLPSGLTINTAIISSLVSASNAVGQIYSTAGTNANVFPTTSQGPWVLFIDTNTSTSLVYLALSTSSSKFVAANGNSPFSVAARSNYYFTVPITGWSSCVQMSDSTTQQVVGATFYQANAQTAVGASFIQCNFDTVTSDTTGSVTTGAGAWKYTAPVAGLYRFDYTISSGNTAWTAAGQIWQVALYKNGSAAPGTPVNTTTSNAAATFRQTCSGSFDIVLNAGDYIDLRLFSSINSVPFNGGGVFGSVQRLSGPASIAANDTVAAFYYASANTTGTSSAPFNFDTKVFDYTGSVTTGAAWKFTAPVAGLYTVIAYTNGSTSPDYIRLYKNGTFYMALGYGPVNSVSTLPADIKLNAGDYIDFRAATSLTANGGSLAANVTSWCSIKKVGTF